MTGRQAYGQQSMKELSLAELAKISGGAPDVQNCIPQHPSGVVVVPIPAAATVNLEGMPTVPRGVPMVTQDPDEASSPAT